MQYPLIPLNLSLIKTIQSHAEIQGVEYAWGAKPCRQDPFPSDSIDVHRADCSGWWQYLMRRAGFNFPEGSVEIHELLKTRGYEPVPNYKALSASRAGKLFLCFIEPVPRAHSGHVWGVSDGVTIECHAGAGVNSRPALTPVLVREFAAAYRVF
jgi:hypothetical protein